MSKQLKKCFALYLCSWSIGILAITPGFGQSKINVDFTIQRSIGGFTTLDRNAYFNMHHGIPDTEFSEEERTYLYQDLKIGNGGRSFSGVGGLGADLKNLPSAIMMQSSGNKNLDRFGSGKLPKGPVQLISTEHPKLVFNMQTNLDSLAQHTANYFKFYYGTARPLPQFYEPMNEPFVHAREFGKDADAVIEAMSLYHAKVGRKLHQEVPSLKLVGYSSAWPEYDLNDFEIWNARMKKFMDIAGAEMDYLSIHLYDGVNLAGEVAKRSGSNSEAILDLIETYSHIKWGQVKPMLVSEFGITGKGWSDYYIESRLPLTVNSMHNLAMGFMERPEVIKLCIPFITGKSKWRLNSGNKTAYQWCISRPSKDNPSTWEFTSLTQFYDFWKNVQGERVASSSSDPDLATQAFIDDKRAFIIIKNLEAEISNIDLMAVTGNMKVKSVLQKSWSIEPDSSVLYKTEKLKAMPTMVRIPAEGAVIFEIEHGGKASAIVEQVQSERKYYANTYLQTIKKGVPLTFNIAGKDIQGQEGEIRLAIGRKTGLELKPNVELNGVPLQVPTDWAGYDQLGRHGFFGAIIIPVEGALIKDNNQIRVIFDDSDGGRVSSVILKTKVLKRK